ncbi:CD27 antigen-like [Rhinatrema bivittatum]|uniref:CD27 antigen-like n=1 Tax=Rhinatrema bivittatum TaxID=194408 RepID=UPI00112B64FA|nr:CD27 antigen-like [Rhinatrema bivittatum]
MEGAWGTAHRSSARLLLALGLCTCFLRSSAPGLLCSQDQYQREGRCCSKCPAGTHIQSRCTSNQDTICQPCLQGSEYNPSWNTKYQCEYCRQCVNQFTYKRRCNITADSQCSCVAGMKCWDEACTRCILNSPTSTSEPALTTATERSNSPGLFRKVSSCPAVRMNCLY